ETASLAGGGVARGYGCEAKNLGITPVHRLQCSPYILQRPSCNISSVWLIFYIYVPSAHDTTSNQHQGCGPALRPPRRDHAASGRAQHRYRDRKSTRLNSSHVKISYAVYRSKKKNPKNDRNVAIHS